MRRISLRSTISAGGAIKQAEQRHDRILQHHHDHEADQRQQIAADRGDDQVEHLRDRGRAHRHAREEFRGMPVGEEADVLAHQLREQLPLVAREDGVGDPRQVDRMAVGRSTADREDHRDGDRQPEDGLEVAVAIGGVDHVLQQVGRERGRSRGDRHQHERNQIGPPVGGALFLDQPPDQPGRAVGVLRDRRVAVVRTGNRGHPACGQRAPLHRGLIARLQADFQVKTGG